MLISTTLNEQVALLLFLSAKVIERSRNDKKQIVFQQRSLSVVEMTKNELLYSLINALLLLSITNIYAPLGIEFISINDVSFEILFSNTCSPNKL